MDDNFSFENFPHDSRQSGNQEFQKVMLRGRGGKAPLGNHMWGQRSRVRYIHSSLRIFCTREKATSINHKTRFPSVFFFVKKVLCMLVIILGLLIALFYFRTICCFSFGTFLCF